MNTEFTLSQLPDSGIDFWGIIVRRKWIVLSASLLGLLGGFLYFVRAQPIYQSTAQVMIERKMPPVLSTNSMDSMNPRSLITDAFKHPVLLRSPLIVSEAVSKFGLAKLPSLSQANAIGRIIQGSSIVPVTEGLGIYNVSFKGEEPADTGQVVNGLLDAYHEFLETNHRNVGRETRDLIVRAEKELITQLNAKEEAYRNFREEAPLIWKGGEGTNLHNERQTAIEARRAEILLQMHTMKAQLKSVEQYLDAGGDPETLLMIEELPKLELFDEHGATESERLVSQRPSDRTGYLQLLLEDEELSARYGADHPRVKSIRRRIDYYKDFYLTNYKVDLDEAPEIGTLAGSAVLSRDDRINQYVAALIRGLQHRLGQLQEQAAQLDELFDSEQDAAKSMAHHQFRDEMFRNDIARTQQLYEIVLKQLEGMDVVGDYEGYNFNILSRAGDGAQIAPIATKVFPMSLILGFLAGGGLALLIDRADKSFHSPVDVGQQLGVPVVGHIPVIEPNQTRDDLPHIAPVLCTIHQPKSHAAEAYRTVRTALFFNARGKSEQVIQVTSPSPGDGKSTLAANLAVVIAHSGKSVLLVDADFRRPTQHKVFGIKSKIGLATVVDGAASANEATQMIDCVPNLSVMACGPRPENPSELLSSIRFREVLAELRHQYDFVIVDTPPLLAVSDPCAVAAQVDGVLLELRITNKSRTQAKRACEILADVGAEIVGVVINGVSSKNRQYSYGAGNYSYQVKKYGYTYAYDYAHEGKA